MAQTHSWPILVQAILVTGCGPYAVVHGPESCDVATVQTDDFGASTRGNNFYWNHNYFAVGISTSNKREPRFHVLSGSDGGIQEDIREGTKLEIALEGAQVIELAVLETATPQVGVGANIFTQWITASPLTKEQLSMLADRPVKAVRTTVGGQGLLVEVVPDPSARLQTLAICLSKY